MARFRIQYAPPYAVTHHSIPITDHYFTVDTADRATLESWKKKNPWNIIYAWQDDDLIGFVEILPITDECGVLLNRQELLEEDLTADFILPPETMKQATYLYISGIAIRDLKSFADKICAAALVSAAAAMIEKTYGPVHLKRIFANPTTYWGNRIIGKFGLKPLEFKKRSIKAGNDIYAVVTDAAFFARMAVLSRKYQAYIANPEALIDPQPDR